MKKHEFYKKYANTPLQERTEVLSDDADGKLFCMTLNDIYFEIKALDDKIRDDEIRREQLLEAVEKHL